MIARDRQRRGLLQGGVVGTLMSNFGLEMALSNLNIPFERAQVGDRYVLEALKDKEWKIGGESSGHIVCLDKTTTGDGIVAALQVLCIMTRQEKTLHELTEGITLLPQTLINLKTNHAADLANNPKVIQAVEKVQASMKGEGRVLLRPSGTEPLLRVMVEGLNEPLVKQRAQELCDDISLIDAG